MLTGDGNGGTTAERLPRMLANAGRAGERLYELFPPHTTQQRLTKELYMHHLKAAWAVVRAFFDPTPAPRIDDRCSQCGRTRSESAAAVYGTGEIRRDPEGKEWPFCRAPFHAEQMS